MPLFSRHKTEETVKFHNFFKNVLGFTPRKRELEVFELAFVHRSNSKEIGGVKSNNERLEYLGDAVLSAVVADFLFKKYPLEGEGFLTETRSKIVSRNNLNKLANKIGLLQLISCRGMSGAFKSLGGNALEALIGAIYLERGYAFTSKVIIGRLINTHIDIDALVASDWNFKSKLIDWGQQQHRKVSFEVVNVIDLGYSKQYESRVLIDGEAYESAVGTSIKSSEQMAAEKTFKHLFPDNSGKTPQQ